MSEETVSVMLDLKQGPPEAESLPEVCPKCGTETIFGFGMAGGGYGPYVACDSDTCDFFAKRQSQE